MSAELARVKLLDQLNHERTRLDSLLDDLGPARGTVPGVVGFWSVRDVLAHIVAHEQRALEEVRLALFGEHLEIDHSDTDDFNARSIAASQSLSFAAVREQWNASYRGVLALVAALPDAAFDPRSSIVAALDDSIEGTLGNNTYDHYAAHRREIEAWLTDAPA